PAPLLPLARAQAFVIATDRDTLNRRIERRAEAMLAGGAVEEVRAALDALGPDAPALKAIGAAEIAAHLAGVPLETTRERLVIATRRYAKRQRTWFRGNMGDWTPLVPA